MTNLGTTLTANRFPNVGYLEVDTPEWVRDIIKDAIGNPGEDWRFNLAGHTQGAHQLPTLISNFEYETWLLDLAMEYDDVFPAYRNTICHHHGAVPLHLHDVWVNHHHKHDFNPMHWHEGVFSYVTWIRVPYTFEDESKQFKTLESSAGQFAFTVTDILGEIHDHIVPQKEWTTLFFPSRMRHKVHPYYTTDEVRVSLSGNLLLMNK